MKNKTYGKIINNSSSISNNNSNYNNAKVGLENYLSERPTKEVAIKSCNNDSLALIRHQFTKLNHIGEKLSLCSKKTPTKTNHKTKQPSTNNHQTTKENQEK
jgi:hypothetical protein